MLVLVLAAIACYAMSLAPVTWVVISEIFPNRIRGRGDVGGGDVAVDRLLPPDLHVSAAQQASWVPAGTFWIYAADLRAGVRVHLCTDCPKPRASRWNRSSIN